MALLGATLMSDETGRLSRCFVPDYKTAHGARRQAECFWRSINEGSRRAVAVHRIADDGFALLCRTPVDGIDRA
jgi:hypothetical protein